MCTYHVSPISNLDELGILTGVNTLHNYYEKYSRFVFLGTMDYIENHYLKYSEAGTWYVYEVDSTDIHMTQLPTEDQWKCGDNIPPHRIKCIKVVDNR